MALQDKRYGVNIDLQHLEIRNARLHQVSADPGAPLAGEIWHNYTDGASRIYDGANVRDLYNADDDFYGLATVVSAQDTDFILLADASDSFNYKKITRANFLAGTGVVSNAYYRIIAQTGVANLDASGTDDINISGDGSIIQTVGSLSGNQTLSLQFIPKTAHTVFMGPASGGAATPTFRALLDSDMPGSYNVTNWNTAYTHSQIITGNPHNVTATQAGAEPALGNPATSGYILSSTTGGVRSWVTPNKLGGQDLNALIVSPGASQDGYSVTWNNSSNEYTLTNITASSGISVSGTPAAGQIGVWASASSMLGNAFLTADFSTDSIVSLGASGANNPIYRLSDGANYFDIYLDNPTNSSNIQAYGDFTILPYTSGNVYIGAATSSNTLFEVSNTTGTARTNIAQFVDSASANVFTITDSGQVYAQSIGGTGTGTSILYYNRTTGEITYADIVGGSGYWSKVSTDVSLATPGDTLLMRVTEKISFGDGDTYFVESADDDLDLYSGTVRTLRFNPTTTIFSVLLSASAGGIDIGTSGQFFRNLYIDGLYVENTSTRIYLDGSGNLTFVDINAGTVILSDLDTGGTVTSVSAGNGMNFTTITGSGAVTMGTPSSTTLSSTNALTATSHTHALDLTGYTGASTIVTVGTIASGIWQGTAIGDTYISSAANWNSKQAGHANLTSLSSLSYVSVSFVKMTAANTFSLDTNTYSLSSHNHSGTYAEISGTPANNQIGVWTGTTAIKGDPNLTWTGTYFVVGISSGEYVSLRASGTSDTIYSRKNNYNAFQRLVYSNTASISTLDAIYRSGGAVGSSAAAPTDAIIHEVVYTVQDSVSTRDAGRYVFQIDGAVATDDFDTKYSWYMKEGASAMALMAILGVNGFEYNADHSTDQAGNNRWIPDKGYVDSVAGGAMVYPGAGIALSTGSSWGTSITNNSANWNTAYSWGNHAGLYDTLGTASSLISTHQSTYNHTNYNTAYSWGNHATAGYANVSATPANNQLAIWTNSTTIEGDPNLTWDTFSLYLGVSGSRQTIISHSAVYAINISNDSSNQMRYVVYSNTASLNNKTSNQRYGGTIGTPAVAPTNAVVKEDEFLIYDGTSEILGGRQNFQVVGAIATGNFETTYNWYLKSGASASTLFLTLGGTGLYYTNDYSAGATDRWIPDKAYVDSVAGGSSPWSVASNIITPTTSGDDVRLAATEQLQFVNNTNYLAGNASNYIDVAANGQSVVRFEGTQLTMFKNIVPVSVIGNKAFNIGSTSLFFDNAYFDTVYIDNISTYIDIDGSGNITFTDANSGTVSLKELVEGTLSFTADTGTTYTFVIGDAGKVVTLSDASPIALTVPPNSSVAFPVGTQITIIQIGAGQVTIGPGSGVTLNSADGYLKLRTQYSSASLIKSATDTWYIVGDLAA